MTSVDGWTCDGVPKSDREYPEFAPHKHHEPELNYGSDCAICGLPKDAMQVRAASTLKLTIVLAGLLLAIVASGVGYVLSQGCSTGLQKVEGECIDPYLQTYETAKEQGDKAIALSKNYQTITDLEKAQLTLARVFAQLNQIPEDANIYSQVATQLESYRAIPIKIDRDLQREKKAQQILDKAQSLARTADGQIATENRAELNNAKQQLESARLELEEIPQNTLVADRLGQLQSEYQSRIEEIDRRLTGMIVPTTPLQPVPQMTAPKPIQPKSPERSTPSKAPVDLCAVDNPPQNCLF